MLREPAVGASRSDVCWIHPWGFTMSKTEAAVICIEWIIVSIWVVTRKLLSFRPFRGTEAFLIRLQHKRLTPNRRFGSSAYLYFALRKYLLYPKISYDQVGWQHGSNLSSLRGWKVFLYFFKLRRTENE